MCLLCCVLFTFVYSCLCAFCFVWVALLGAWFDDLAVPRPNKYLPSFKTTRHHRLLTSHFTAGMLFWLNMWTCSSQPCVKVPNPSYKFCVKSGEVQKVVRISKQERCQVNKTTNNHSLPTSHFSAGMLFMWNVFAAYVVSNLQHVVHYFVISLLNFIMTIYAAWLL